MNNTIILKDNLSASFELITYPDGQHTIKLNFDTIDIKSPVKIKCRIKTFAELEVLSCLVAALKRAGYYVQKIYFIYLFGMRCDRPFSEEEPNYFKDVVAPIINSYGLPQIELYRPHSYISCYYINNYKFSFTESIVDGAPFYIPQKPSAYTTICGDKSEADRRCKPLFFNKQRLGREIVIASCPYFDENPDEIEDILLVDDLCDAGGTFIAEAIYLRERSFKGKIVLFVEHGLFTKGLEPLLEHFDHIYCTNSYQDIDHPRVTQFKVI